MRRQHPSDHRQERLIQRQRDSRAFASISVPGLDVPCSPWRPQATRRSAPTATLDIRPVTIAALPNFHCRPTGHKKSVRSVATRLVRVEVLTLPETGLAPEDRAVGLYVRPVGRVVASLRDGRWDDPTAGAVPLTMDDLGNTVRSSGGTARSSARPACLAELGIDGAAGVN
jgi:hypothetical protein